MLSQSVRRGVAGTRRPTWYSGFAAHVHPRALVFSGIAMFALYIAMDVVASLRYDGYSYKDQTISELSAIGAPTRNIWLVFSVAYTVLAFAFAFGVLLMAGRRKTVRAVGWIFLAGAIGGLTWWFGPMHQREVLAADGGTWQDTLHLVAGGISSLVFFSAIGVGMFAFGRAFRWYSILTIGLMLVFGMLMNMDVAEVGNDEPTPWLGIYERIAVEGAMLWEAVFAAMLLWAPQRKVRRLRTTEHSRA